MERAERSIISNFLGKDSGNEMGLLGDRREGRRKDVRCHPGAAGSGWVGFRWRKTRNCGRGLMSDPEGDTKC